MLSFYLDQITFEHISRVCIYIVLPCVVCARVCEWVYICLNIFVCYASFLKEGNVLFDDTLNTFYLRLYGVKHKGKEPLIAREESRCRHFVDYSFRLVARDLLHAFVTPVVEHWLERKIS